MVLLSHKESMSEIFLTSLSMLNSKRANAPINFNENLEQDDGDDAKKIKMFIWWFKLFKSQRSRYCLFCWFDL